MAGSQLKQLKAALKSKGLVGQTNVKKKNKKLAPSETRKDQEEKKRALGKIHDEFNLFDNRINRTKHDYTIIQGGKFVKAGSKQHNDAAKSRAGIEKAMKVSYEADKRLRGRAGGIVDRRFGEKNKNLTEEEKMLERFTKERQSSSKKNVFSLGSDDEYDNEDDGFALTHSGKTLSFEQDFDESDLGVSDKKYMDEDSIQPPKKKSKKEVMAEIIAKSKFYKQQRQMEFQKTQDEIMDLDEELGDVLSELNQLQAQKSKKPKSQEDIEYDAKVKELTYDRRAVPADRTKTEEELAAEHDEKMKKLEADRLKRMEGLHDDREADADDLDDEFWENESGEEKEDGSAESGDESESGSEEDTESKRPARAPPVSMPLVHAQFAEQVEGMKGEEVIKHIKKVSEVYHPRLAEGNKEKMDRFVGIIFEHILHISNKEVVDSKLVDDLTKLLRTMAEKYNQALVEIVRKTIDQIGQRVVSGELRKGDLVCFVVLGYVFSASDHYHLVITPALIVMNQFLNNEIGVTHVEHIGKGLFICDVLLQYQSFAKRYDPEVTKYLERVFVTLLPESKLLVEELQTRPVTGKNNLGKKFHPKVDNGPIKVQSLFETPDDNLKFRFVRRAFATIDRIIALWKEKSAFLETLKPFISIAKHASRYFLSDLPELQSLLERMIKLETNLSKSRRPLTLQEHRQLAIKTFAPKFEENFNPDKKLYDENRDRQELNKIRAQIKKEKKGALKDLRKQTKFTARQQISEKKDMYATYHKKMANIVNTISTEEGAEKNLYDRERKRRANKR